MCIPPVHTLFPQPCLRFQLAKALGLYVVGIAGPSNQEFVKSLGADEVRVSCISCVNTLVCVFV